MTTNASVASCTSGDLRRSCHSAKPASGHAGKAAEIVDPEPFVEQGRRVQVESRRPDERPRQKGAERDEPASQVGAAAPLTEKQKPDGRQAEQARAEQALREERDTGT